MFLTTIETLNYLNKTSIESLKKTKELIIMCNGNTNTIDLLIKEKEFLIRSK